MQTLWSHPFYLAIQNAKDLAINLQEQELHSEKRVETLTFQAPFWNATLVHQDYSTEGFKQLIRLAEARGALNWMHAMQKGELINSLENSPERFAALHTALRAQNEEDLLEKGKEVRSLALEQIDRYRELLNSNPQIETLVVLGIGGSQLGPDALLEALKPSLMQFKEVIFIPNIDPAAQRAVFRRINLSRTWIAAISKSGSTLETRESELWWRNELEKAGLNPAKQMIAVTTKSSRLDKPSDYLACLYFDSSIGGRYSATSAVGMVPIAFAFGMNIFEEILKGAYSMDQHALKCPSLKNLPLALAATSIWQRQICKRPTQAIIPYRQSLHRFAAHLQQLEMESLGKRTDKQMRPLEGSCGPLIMGEPGTCAQHSFFQWLHQGTDIVPIDFIMETSPALTSEHEKEMADQLLANALAQSFALAKGKSDTLPSKTCPGGRPSTLLACEILSPQALGSLLSLYEHKTAFEGFILGINPFDQEGVELGKHMACELYKEILAYRQSNHTTKPWWQVLFQPTA